MDPVARATGVLVAFGDRHGGVSRAPYDTLNLAARGGDDPSCVRVNRRRAAHAAGFDARALALARQVHGAEVMEVGAGASGVLGEADGLVARTPGPVLAMLTADCAPVVVAGADGVALLHAGWRGLVAGVVGRGVARVGVPRAAWIGPAIRSCCYEVGREVMDAFERAGLPTLGDRVDPADAARSALTRAGVERVAVADECTACSARYFSYRRDGVTGRQGAFAALLPAV
ncbi:purine nucleoside phosphorylase YfiH [soil metagenome]